MLKPVRGAGDSAPLFGPANERMASVARSGNPALPHTKVARNGRAGKKKSQFIDGIVNGERVLIAKPPKPLEKSIEIQIRVALAAAGVMVMKHHVDNRGHQRTGLGLGVSDLICIVPPTGRFLAIEVKRPGYSPSDVRPDQSRWLAVVGRFGAISGIASSVEEALALVEQARAT